MQATIYVTEEAFAVANEIKDLDYGERMLHLDAKETDLSKQEGYYLMNANYLRINSLPANACVPIRLTPEDAETYGRYVSLPAHLRGCIFSNAPRLPDNYAEIVQYWSGEPMNANDSRAVFFQCPSNEYMVTLTEIDTDGIMVANDPLISDGIVVCLENVGELTSGLSPESFIEVKIPALESMLGIEPDDYRSTKAYPISPSEQYERIFLKVSDIIASPDKNRVYVSAIRHELIDYGLTY